jgi:hypothetical protein
LSLPVEHVFPVIRRPSLYPLIAQDTLEPYTEKQLGQPKATQFASAALNPSGPKGRTVEGVASAITAAIQAQSPSAVPLRLVVLPQGLFDLYDLSVVSALGKRPVATSTSSCRLPERTPNQPLPSASS